jgi:creatinine amidohydrolase
VAVPIGALEQHGTHLPSGTDTTLVTAVTVSAARRAKNPVLVTPTLAYGLSPYHGNFVSTISLRLATLLAVLRDISENLAASGFTRIVLVNGHGGNSPPLRALVAEMVADGLPVAAIDYWRPSEAEWRELLRGPLKTLGHGCELETSLQLALSARDPQRSRDITEAARNLPIRMEPPWVEPGAIDPILPHGAAWAAVFQPGDYSYTGSPALADAQNGQAMLEMMITGLARFFDDFAQSRLRTGGSARTRLR